MLLLEIGIGSWESIFRYLKFRETNRKKKYNLQALLLVCTNTSLSVSLSCPLLHAASVFFFSSHFDVNIYLYGYMDTLGVYTRQDCLLLATLATYNIYYIHIFITIYL